MNFPKRAHSWLYAASAVCSQPLVLPQEQTMCLHILEKCSTSTMSWHAWKGFSIRMAHVCLASSSYWVNTEHDPWVMPSSTSLPVDEVFQELPNLKACASTSFQGVVKSSFWLRLNFPARPCTLKQKNNGEVFNMA